MRGRRRKRAGTVPRPPRAPTGRSERPRRLPYPECYQDCNCPRASWSVAIWFPGWRRQSPGTKLDRPSPATPQRPRQLHATRRTGVADQRSVSRIRRAPSGANLRAWMGCRSQFNTVREGRSVGVPQEVIEERLELDSAPLGAASARACSIAARSGASARHPRYAVCRLSHSSGLLTSASEKDRAILGVINFFALRISDTPWAGPSGRRLRPRLPAPIPVNEQRRDRSGVRVGRADDRRTASTGCHHRRAHHGG